MTHPRGFSNRGATCWLNSLTQALLCLEHFAPHYKLLTPDGIISRRDIPPAMLRGQQCADEGLVQLLDRHADMQKKTINRYRQRVNCDHCHETHETVQKRTHTYVMDNKAAAVRGIPDVFRSREEHLSDYVCEKCGSKGGVLKEQWCFGSQVLIIVLNRFTTKDSFTYPLEFQVSGLHYTLKAQILHSGSRFGGHYIAQGIRNGKHYVFNDSQVHPITDFVITPGAFVLFYERK